MFDYQSMPDDELRNLLLSASSEWMARKRWYEADSPEQHLYRISMRRTPKAEPQAFRYTVVDDTVVQLPLSLDQVIGRSGKVIGGDFWLEDGDVIQKIAASGMISHLIAWQGYLDNQDYDVGKVLEGATEAETITKVEAFLRGDRSLLIQELTEMIAFWRERLPESEEKGRTNGYWSRVAASDRDRIDRLEAMLRWAESDVRVGACA